MPRIPLYCPNSDCPNHRERESGFYIKKGYRRTSHNGQKVPRYQCKSCLKYFSATSTKRIQGQHRPELNRDIFRMAVSGVTYTRIAKLLGCSETTVARKVKTLAEQAKDLHASYLANTETSLVMIDMLHTFLHSRHKPIGIIMSIRVKTREVISFSVCKIIGRKIGKDEYEWTVSDQGQAFQDMLRPVRFVLADQGTIVTDGHTSYPQFLREGMGANDDEPAKPYTHEVAKSPTKSREREYDPLFAINHTLAQMRNDMARLHRKTWTTTKTMQGLEQHLWLWVAWKNGYELK